MNPEIIEQLLAINARFYREQAASFSNTRQHLQPGVQRIIDRLLKDRPQASLLDLGCGNSQLGHYLCQHNFKGTYWGVDASLELLEEAKKASPYPFIHADLSRPDWDGALPQAAFDVVLVFSMLHHLPGEAVRMNLLRQIRSHLSLSGWLIHSEWQFQNSSRLESHLVPPESVGLQAADLEAGDHLLDWRAGGQTGIRYVHFFTPEELTGLAERTGFSVEESFNSDGREGNLGLYQIWKKA